jgi:hypothetical protein
MIEEENAADFSSSFSVQFTGDMPEAWMGI